MAAASMFGPRLSIILIWICERGKCVWRVHGVTEKREREKKNVGDIEWMADAFKTKIAIICSNSTREMRRQC